MGKTADALRAHRRSGFGALFKFRGSGCGLGRFHFYILIVSDHLITLKMFKSLIDFLMDFVAVLRIWDTIFQYVFPLVIISGPNLRPLLSSWASFVVPLRST